MTAFVRRIIRTIDSLHNPINLRGLVGLPGLASATSADESLSGGVGVGGGGGSRETQGVPVEDLKAMRRAPPPSPPRVYLATDSVDVEEAMMDALGERLVVQPSSSASSAWALRTRTARGRAVQFGAWRARVKGDPGAAQGGCVPAKASATLNDMVRGFQNVGYFFSAPTANHCL